MLVQHARLLALLLPPRPPLLLSVQRPSHAGAQHSAPRPSTLSAPARSQREQQLFTSQHHTASMSCCALQPALRQHHSTAAHTPAHTNTRARTHLLVPPWPDLPIQARRPRVGADRAQRHRSQDVPRTPHQLQQADSCEAKHCALAACSCCCRRCRCCRCWRGGFCRSACAADSVRCLAGCRLVCARCCVGAHGAAAAAPASRPWRHNRRLEHAHAPSCRSRAAAAAAAAPAAAAAAELAACCCGRSLLLLLLPPLLCCDC
jgi:hypothetical protein